MKRGRGQPTVLTPAVQKKIADCFFDGLTDVDTALLCDINQKTIQRMRAGNYCPAIKKAEAARKQFYIRKIRDGTRQDWTRIAWFLERRFPLEFSRPEVQLQVNTAVTAVTAITITAAQAEHNATRLKEVDTRIDRFLESRSANGDEPADQ